MDFSQYEFPSNWKIQPLNEVCQFTKKPRGLKLQENIPFFPMEVIPEDGIYAQTSIYKKSNKLGSGTFVNRGDVVVAKITPSFENGKQAIIDIKEPHAYATVEISNIASRLDTKVDNFLLRKLKFNELFQTLLHQLMTAKIRVSELNLNSLNLDLEE